MNTLIERNKLLTKLLWGALALGILVDVANKISMKVILTLAVFGTIICGIITYLVITKKCVPFIKYLVTVAMGIFSYLLLSASQSFVNLLIIYFSLAIIALYHDYRPIVFSGFIGLFLINFSFVQYRNTMFKAFEVQHLISLNLYLVLITELLIAQTRIGEKMRLAIENSKEEALKSKDEVNSILSEVKKSVKTLSDFSSRLKDIITEVSSISSNVTKVFSEISSGADSEVKSISHINDSVIVEDKSFKVMAQGSQDMCQVSSVTADIINEGQEHVETLTNKMDKVNGIINNTVNLMKELNNQTEEIGVVLSTIRGIAEQTNLLALNASIEAARAGEYGRGFTVVSNEVLKLADNSRDATEHIASILENIKDKIKIVGEQINLGQKGIESSIESRHQVHGVFKRIEENTMNVVQKANDVENMAQALQKSSSSITEEIQTMASVTEQNTTSVEAVMESIEDQDRRISEIVQSFSQLEELTELLKGLLEKEGLSEIKD